jgi:large subunit ribosomal protein L5e
MPFVKVVKNKAYFKRYQVKFRRRREGKTDYRARKRLVCQDRNKYNTPKYRLVVRFSNKACICQIVYSEIVGDKVMCCASSTELGRYGLKVGLKNYAAAYCTGLLCARRLLKKIGLDSVYKGNLTYEESDDEGSDDEEFEYSAETISCQGGSNGKRTYYVEELDDDQNPFRCILDVGITTTSTGARVFGALKGAVDGGLDIPHGEKRFPGYDRDAKEYDADVHKERIFGEHVSEYMKYLIEEDAAKYATHFAAYEALEIGADDLEELYQEVHKSIRADPTAAEKKEFSPDKSFKRMKKISIEERKAAVEAKRATLLAEQEEDDDEDDDDEDEEDDE